MIIGMRHRYMIFDGNGNAVNSFEDFTSAAEFLKKAVEVLPEDKDELVILEYNKYGMAINACSYKDLIK